MKFQNTVSTFVTILATIHSAFAICTNTTGGAITTPDGVTYTASSMNNAYNAIAYSLSDVYGAITDCDYIGGAFTTLPVLSSTILPATSNFIYSYTTIASFWPGLNFSANDAIFVYTAYFVRKF